MAESKLFTVRPTSKQARADHRDTFRVYLSPASLLQVKLRVGELCQLETYSIAGNGHSGGAVDSAAAAGGSKVKTAIAWTAAEKIHDNIIQTSKPMQELYGLRLGDKVSVSPASDPLADIEAVRLEEVKRNPTGASQAASPAATELAAEERSHWEWALEYPLSKCEVVSLGLAFDIELKGVSRRFKVVHIDAGSSSGGGTFNTVFKYTEHSKVVIGKADEASGDADSASTDRLEVTADGLGGLAPQLAMVNERLQDFNTQEQSITMPSFYKSSGGILIYGPKGTGKSALLAKIGDTNWRRTFAITSSITSRAAGDSAAVLRKIFSDALKYQPSLIKIDQLEFIAPKRSSTGPNDASLSPALCEGLDSLQDSRVLVVACTRHPNDVDDSLRTPHRLGIEVELQIPTSKSRLEILQALRGSAPQPTDRILGSLAAKTHGYVGADLLSLLQLSCRKAKARMLAATPSVENSISSRHYDEKDGEYIKSDLGLSNDKPGPLEICEQDMILAMKEARPTAMREVFLETPSIRWSDIGGQRYIKSRLQKAVERPLKKPERMKNLNISGKKGILLYGPPGCSKTMMVKALATEAGLNFLAVKGAEMLSMYVGESERAMREIFRKARAASPSIIFFDEIDAIAARRDAGSHGGINILTTLLNEMDGIEELKNVLVVAATNKPEILDPALMRPGRLDNILYIGLPDMEARKEIFENWISRSDVSDHVDAIVLASLTDGHSGAELVNICETAAELCLDDEEARELPDLPIQLEHFQASLSMVPKRTQPEVIQAYEEWSRSFGNNQQITIL
ncbi:peroxisome biogenesis factor 1 [Nannizzia gypsea CBS 118893]|uniref:Peroxisome biogenesis factor 1 n=1 Tax=Arthroderma gypseum (strain ATCC MYA-4604 / CBS 118893) TaxID=535722 RepID=E4V604_ARTGP|nr:peroxisome biogenesis factor 1 [Nannizzia gypsea CBS 118893]EFR05529.1 peroxisome biogenesis factor 1 [Nannizzia gypsea CBS 118893]